MRAFLYVGLPLFNATNFGTPELIVRTEELHAVVHFADFEIPEQSLGGTSAHWTVGDFGTALRTHDMLVAVPRNESGTERNPIANDTSLHLGFRIGEEFVAQTE